MSTKENRGQSAFSSFSIRTVVIFLLAISVIVDLPLAGASWRKKTPDQWDEQEINQVLTNSPWARKAEVSFSNPAGGSRTRSQIPGGSPGPNPRRRQRRDNEAWSQPLIRWQSAEAIRSAFAKAGVPVPGGEFIHDYFVIAFVGLPDLGGRPGGRLGARHPQNREEVQARLQETARLCIGNKNCYAPERVEQVDQDGESTILLLFVRREVRSGDKLKFYSPFGPLQISADFKTKDMQFGCGLDL
jgi:hypothetical protein